MHSYPEMDSSILEAVSLHERWVHSKTKFGERLILEGKDLSGYDLRGRNLRNAILKKCNLTKTDIRDAILIKADLKKSDLTNILAFRANFTDACLKDVIALNGRFINTIMRNADLTGAQIPGSDLSTTDLTTADLSNANCNNCNFTNAGLIKTRLNGASLYNAIWRSTHIDRILCNKTKGLAKISVYPLFEKEIILVADTPEHKGINYRYVYENNRVIEIEEFINHLKYKYGVDSPQVQLIKMLMEVRA